MYNRYIILQNKCSVVLYKLISRKVEILIPTARQIVRSL